MIDFAYNPIIPADYKSQRERTSSRSLSLGRPFSVRVSSLPAAVPPGANERALRSGAEVPAEAGTPTLRSVRGIFPDARVVGKNDPFLSAANGGGNQEGAPAPSWTLPGTVGRGTGVPGRLPAAVEGACCPARRGAALPAGGPLRRRRRRTKDGRGRFAARRGRGTGDGRGRSAARRGRGTGTACGRFAAHAGDEGRGGAYFRPR